MNNIYLGVMSGTSLDGVDITLCRCDNNSCELIHSFEYIFDESLKEDILSCINSTINLKTMGEIDTKLGVMYAKYINDFINKFDIDKTKIEAIGLHGQTLWHSPNSKYPFSMQLGNSSLVNAQTGIKVVSNFRQKDIALGGQGAPLTPAFHQFLFKDTAKGVSILNIGGMANITILGERLQGYDTGCGNVLLDLWMQKCSGKKYDKNGMFAKSGDINEALLTQMMSEAYFSLKSPKSTGRELFNKHWLDKHLENFRNLNEKDIQATLLRLTTQSIANEIKKTDTKLLLLCGGGSKNIALLNDLKNLLEGIEVYTTDSYGVNSDFLESLAFAWFAHKRIKKEKIEISSVTGAREDTILGCIYE